MNEPSFNGISKSDMKYVDYLARNDFHGLAMLCVETDLSASHRIKKIRAARIFVLQRWRSMLFF